MAESAAVTARVRRGANRVPDSIESRSSWATGRRYRHGLGGDFSLRFVDDSPQEEERFEPSVPVKEKRRER